MGAFILTVAACGVLVEASLTLWTNAGATVFVLLTTVTHGADAAAWERNGADVRVRGPQMTDEVVAALRAIEGVEAVARLRDAGTTFELSAGEDRTPVRVLLADAELSSVMPAGGPAAGPPPGLYAEGGPVPVLAGGSAPARSGPASVRGVGEVVVLGHAAELPGFRTPGSWVLISAERWEGAGRSVPAATTALVPPGDARVVLGRAGGAGVALVTAYDADGEELLEERVALTEGSGGDLELPQDARLVRVTPRRTGVAAAVVVADPAVVPQVPSVAVAARARHASRSGRRGPNSSCGKPRRSAA